MPAAGDWPDLLAQELLAAPDLRLEDWAARHGLAPATLSRGFLQSLRNFGRGIPHRGAHARGACPDREGRRVAGRSRDRNRVRRSGAHDARRQRAYGAATRLLAQVERLQEPRL